MTRDVLMSVLVVYFSLHVGGSLFRFMRKNSISMKEELVRQHHEKCVILVMIAMAIMEVAYALLQRSVG